MKKIIYILTITLFVAAGCTDWLDLKPEGEVILDDYWQNESQVNQVLASCYRSMLGSGFMSRMLVWGELRSDNVTFGNGILSIDMYKMLNVDITPSNSFCHWGAMYTTINYCNNFLYYAPEVLKVDPNLTESELRAMEAEVLTIRSLAYFYLVRTFEQVPWNTTPSIDDTQNYNIPKSTESAVLDSIVGDLETALIYAREKFDIEEYNKGRITKNAVRALLADIYLWRKDYNNCIIMCNQILENNEQDLELELGENVLTNVFGKGNSKESIFELQFDDKINNYNIVLSSYYGIDGNEEGAWSFPAVLVTGDYSPFNYKVGASIESKEDLREKDFLKPETGGDKYWVFKYAGASREPITSSEKSKYSYRTFSANWIVYRLSEIYLMKAEALIQLETNMQEALDLINITYMRSNTDLEATELTLSNYNSKLDMENLLLRERQRELMFEGKRWFDLMRVARRAGSPTPLLNYVAKKEGASTSQLSKIAVMEALYLPIHTDELKANTALEQNTFYELNAEGNNY